MLMVKVSDCRNKSLSLEREMDPGASAIQFMSLRRGVVKAGPWRRAEDGMVGVCVKILF